MTALEEWQAERDRLAREYRVRKDGPQQPEAFREYMAGSRDAFRRFARSEPEMADRLFAGQMLAASGRAL